MSYILEALKKADRERTLGEVPDLESAHWGVRQPKRSWRWLWVVAVLLLFNAGLLGYLLSRDEGSTEQIADRTSPPPPVVATPRAPASPPPVVATPRAPASPPPVQAPARSPTVVVRPKVAVPPHVVPRQAIDTPPAPVPERVVQAQGPLTAQTSAKEAELPEWNELPLEFRSSFNLPHIDVHVYAETPQRRFILVDLQKYREGETLRSGAVLEKIQPNSIQLNYQGTRFRVNR